MDDQHIISWKNNSLVCWLETIWPSFAVCDIVALLSLLGLILSFPLQENPSPSCHFCLIYEIKCFHTDRCTSSSAWMRDQMVYVPYSPGHLCASWLPTMHACMSGSCTKTYQTAYLSSLNLDTSMSFPSPSMQVQCWKKNQDFQISHLVIFSFNFDNKDKVCVRIKVISNGMLMNRKGG
jgi:hypothetical protein